MLVKCKLCNRKKLLFLILGLLLLSSSSSSFNHINAIQDNLLLNPKNEFFDINIVFIGFNSDLILNGNIKSKLPDYLEPFSGVDSSFPHSRYSLNYSFSHLSELQTQTLEEYLLEIAINRTISSLRTNITSMEQLLTTGLIENPMDLFIPYGGLTFDADLVEEYIFQNIYEPYLTNPGYTLYLMNFSQFDSADHKIEHTYTLQRTEYDSNITMSLNQLSPVFEAEDYTTTAGWGGKHRFCYIDVSANPDVLQLIPIIYGGSGDYTNTWSEYYYRQDLDSFVASQDMTSITGKTALSAYLAQWISPYINTLFLPLQLLYEAGQIRAPSVAETIYIPIKVFNNVSKYGYTTEKISWFLSPHRIQTQLEEAFPWISWKVDIEYIEFEDETILKDYFLQNVKYDGEKSYLDADEGLIELLYAERVNYFDLSAAELVIPSYVFLADDVYLHYRSTQVGGLGGIGFQVMSRTPFDLFESGDATKPRKGLSTVTIHEIGHSLGLNHPHNDYDGWSSGYIEDTMSYIALDYCVPKFSTFLSDATARLYYDYYYISAAENVQNIDNANIIGKDKATQLLNESYTSYLEMDYISAIETVREAWKISNKLSNPLRRPVVLISIIVCGVSLTIVLVIYSKTNLFTKRKNNKNL